MITNSDDSWFIIIIYRQSMQWYYAEKEIVIDIGTIIFLINEI